MIEEAFGNIQGLSRFLEGREDESFYIFDRDLKRHNWFHSDLQKAQTFQGEDL